MKEKFKQYIARKSKIGIVADFFILTLLILTLIPQTRMGVMSTLIKGRMFFVQPSVLDADEITTLADTDYQVSFKDLNGQDFDFATLKGKVIFLNYWATWCPPCVAEFPVVQELYNLYKENKDVAFLLVSSEAPEEIHKFLKKNGYTIPIYLQNGKLPEALSSSSIPTTFVISKTGKVVIREVGAVNWTGESMIKTMDGLLKEIPTN